MYASPAYNGKEYVFCVIDEIIKRYITNLIWIVITDLVGLHRSQTTMGYCILFCLSLTATFVAEKSYTGETFFSARVTYVNGFWSFGVKRCFRCPRFLLHAQAFVPLTWSVWVVWTSIWVDLLLGLPKIARQYQGPSCLFLRHPWIEVWVPSAKFPSSQFSIQDVLGNTSVIHSMHMPEPA